MKKLFLLTDGFPYGKGEKTFIQPELPFLVENFDVTLISRASTTDFEDRDALSITDDRIKVIHYDPSVMSFFDKVVESLSFFISDIGRSELRKIIAQRKMVFTRIKKSIEFYALANRMAVWINKCIPKDDQNIVIYCFWSNFMLLAADMVKKKHPSISVVARAHGYDLYNHTYLGYRQPFKQYMDKETDRFMFIADRGLKYWIKHFSTNHVEKKYFICRLGIQGGGFQGKHRMDTSLRVVSCSSLVKGKRVNLIVKALAKLPFDVEWVHFGDGDQRDEVEDLAIRLLPDNVNYKFMGNVKNSEIMAYYANESVDCFITTSESEGAPVSIMEAMSFGIPIIGTDVGDVGFMVEGNGILLSDNPHVAEISDAIMEIHNETDEHIEQLRKVSLEKWRKYYNAENNSKIVIKLLNE